MSDLTRNRMSNKASEIAGIILSSDSVVIAAHIDADGIAAGAIASSALERAEIEHETLFLKKLDDQSIDDLDKRSEESLVWLTDLGSAYSNRFSGKNIVISDHHEADIDSQIQPLSGQTTLHSFRSIEHLNPLFFGYSGAREISGSGLAFLIAMAMDEANEALVRSAVIGAVGDMQDLDTRRLIGVNADIVRFGVEHKRIEKCLDLRLFGTETRSLIKLLEYSSDPVLPGLTGNFTACEEFLRMLNIDTIIEGNRKNHWSNLTERQKRRVVTALSRHILENGGDQADVERLLGEVYTFPGEAVGSPTREAREFATLLNSCGRNEMSSLGMEICKSTDRETLERAFDLLRRHRENLSKAMGHVKEIGIAEFGCIRHFHCADQVKDTIVGIITGMLLGSGDIDRSKPLVGFAISKEDSDEFKIKASIRTIRELVDQGVNLATAVRSAAESVGGIGGGHNIAAGATIPLGTEKDFLSNLERLVREQLVIDQNIDARMDF